MCRRTSKHQLVAFLRIAKMAMTSARLDARHGQISKTTQRTDGRAGLRISIDLENNLRQILTGLSAFLAKSGSPSNAFKIGHHGESRVQSATRADARFC